MNLRTLPNDELLARTQGLVTEERRLGLQVLHHLQEIDRRRLHAERGFSSLHEYCVKALGYSDGAAFRRVAAMRALRELPELEEKIQAGSLNLTTVSQAQSFFQQEKKAGRPYTPERKKEIFESMRDKSKAQCEKILQALNPEAPQTITLRYEVSPELQKQLQELERTTGKTGTDLLQWLVEQAQKRASPEKLAASQQSKPLPITQTRYIPAALKRAVLQKTGHRCT